MQTAKSEFTTPAQVKRWIRAQAMDLGFADCGFVHAKHPTFAIQLQALQEWLAAGQHGQMQFLELHHDKRANPAQLVEGTHTIISVRMDYLTDVPKPRSIEDNQRPNYGIIARYARGRDYHKVMRNRLKQLGQRIDAMLPQWQELDIHPNQEFVYRPFSDSAPIFERALAEAAGLGWTGKHTLLIDKQAGSFFVLGELFTSLHLPADQPVSAHCGSCRACIDICPTQAIIAPYQLNASACISYLTIEHQGSIDPNYRHAIGNRVFGCDDCQLICPWNRYARITPVADFATRASLANTDLLQLWAWDEALFLQATEGTPLRRTGYHNFMRNVAIALGNSPFAKAVVSALTAQLGHRGDMVNEHIEWALAQQRIKAKPSASDPKKHTSKKNTT